MAVAGHGAGVSLPGNEPNEAHASQPQNILKKVGRNGGQFLIITSERFLFRQNNNDLPMRAEAHAPISFADASFGHRFL
jgi:hypothetical protein